MAQEVSFEIMENNIDFTKGELLLAVKRALEQCGGTAEGYAKALCPTGDGILKNSITHAPSISEITDTVEIGTNIEYAPYVELGTGKYAEEGGHGGGWWVYVKGGGGGGGKTSHKRYSQKEAARIVAILKSKGLDAHMTEGQRPQPFLRPALKDHMDEWKHIIEKELKG